MYCRTLQLVIQMSTAPTGLISVNKSRPKLLAGPVARFSFELHSFTNRSNSGNRFQCVFEWRRNSIDETHPMMSRV